MTAIANDDEMALSEHIEEFSQRLVFCVLILIIATIFVSQMLKKLSIIPSPCSRC